MLFHDALDPHRDLMSADPITKQLSERDIFSKGRIDWRWYGGKIIQ